jgi:hypothetical protein
LGYLIVRGPTDIDAEFGHDRPTFAIKTCPQQLEQVPDDKSMTHRAAGHHQDMPPGELIAPLASLDPGEERGFIHVQIVLDVHGRLIIRQYNTAGR